MIHLLLDARPITWADVALAAVLTLPAMLTIWLMFMAIRASR